MSKDKSEVKLMALISHMKLKLKRQLVLVKWHDEHTCERAISNTKANTINELINLANDYLEGKEWLEEMVENIKLKKEKK